jgi:hypothetical protein
MINQNSILFFINIFCILIILKNLFKFLGTLSQKNPEPMDISDRGLFYLGLSVSYIITYLYFK